MILKPRFAYSACFPVTNKSYFFQTRLHFPLEPLQKVKQFHFLNYYSIFHIEAIFISTFENLLFLVIFNLEKG